MDRRRFLALTGGALVAGTAGVGVLAVLLQRWLPATPGLRSVLLQPPAEPEFDDGEALADLVGVEGLTTSRLAPAGKARIGGEVRDVTTEGGLVEPGTAVSVVAVRGGRLVVVAENHSEIGGLGEAVATALLTAGVTPRFRRIALPDAFLDAGALPTLHERYGISSAAIARTLKGWLS